MRHANNLLVAEKANLIDLFLPSFCWSNHVIKEIIQTNFRFEVCQQ